MKEAITLDTRLLFFHKAFLYVSTLALMDTGSTSSRKLLQSPESTCYVGTSILLALIQNIPLAVLLLLIYSLTQIQTGTKRAIDEMTENSTDGDPMQHGGRMGLTLHGKWVCFPVCFPNSSKFSYFHKQNLNCYA